MCSVDRELDELLVSAAAGDVDAFMRFYDATSRWVFALERVRAVRCGRDRRQVRAAAVRASGARFVQAWTSAADQESSGLSPLAWLLTLPTVQPEEATRA
jgi:hypothetical protein